ncbi:aspartic proteinase-like protein 1 isoform X1 [Lycium barbarum]|uniref:aspartic proteinase-like protein 1 isoform X1 n=1 Tax=Lycium barbarum TaxID=112863 RepID=UPI00293F0D5A|nr:aspartic proteinase-like protein 1 isoform X1 [Lycium barbarum]
MSIVVVLTAAALLLLLSVNVAVCNTFSSRLIHGFSDEAVSFLASKGKTSRVTWPKRESVEHARLLLSNDLKRQRLKKQFLLFPSQGSQTHFYGNDLSWLHYAWIDIGTPNTSFLVALDAGSDLLWVPCNCVQCAPLSSSYYSMLDKDLNEYSPARSSTSKHLSCSHELCQLGPNCQNPKERCPYTVNYYSENTSSSGFLFEDQLHLTSVGGHEHQGSVRASIVVGCGSKQSGSYLNGAAPDGVMGLGPGEISVPSLLAKSGFVPRSFSLCFGKNNSGTIFFGDQGPESQRQSSFVSLNGKYNTYVVEVQRYCVGGSCPKQSGFQALVDSGSSFTYLPSKIFTEVVTEFEEQINATRLATEDFPYCYKASSRGLPNIPTMKLVLAANQSFVIQNPMFTISNGQGDNYYCVGILPIEGMIGIIGQNLMEGYRMVFDWENMKLGWSRSKCQDIGGSAKVPPTPPPSGLTTNPLPTTEQQRSPGGHAVAPAIAGKATPKPSAASLHAVSWHCAMSSLLLSLVVWLPYKI